jgi:formylglycine-generating enzyme required for sulfatase activity
MKSARTIANHYERQKDGNGLNIMKAAELEIYTDLLLELQNARKETETLFSTLRSEYLYERPIRERHRVIFYVGHLDAFDYIQICREGLGQKSREPALDSLFQAGIDPDATHLPSDTSDDWPSLEQVNRYVTQARAAVDEALEAAPEAAVNMAIEHRLMHLETLAYMWHNFDYTMKVNPESATEEASDSYQLLDHPWCDVPEGSAVLGKPHDGSFGWDNEYDEHVVDVPQFRMQRHKVTNGDYLRFVREGGPVPHFWTERNGRFFLRGMFQMIPLPLDWPVYVTYQQAASYAAWLGKVLPSEAQYHRAAFGTPSNSPRAYPWGDSAPARQFGNFDFKRWSPESVYASPAGDSRFGLRQLTGNGWEWTRTIFAPFAGFSPSASYPGYSANFFDGQHYVLKGGSPRTAARLLRRSFRNWFRLDYPYVYAAFRCVEN